MNNIDKLNNLISNIEKLKSQKRSRRAVNYDDINLSNLNIEIIVGSKVDIKGNNFVKPEKVHLESYLEAIERYKKYRNFAPKYEIDTLDLNLDINLEIKQKILLEKEIVKAKKEENRYIELLNSLQTSLLLYKNIEKKQNYKAEFDDLSLDIELEYTDKIASFDKPKVEKRLERVKERLQENKFDKVSVLKEKLENIKKFKNSEKIHRTDSEKIEISVFLQRYSNKSDSKNIYDDKVELLKEKLRNIENFRKLKKVSKSDLSDLHDKLELGLEIIKKGQPVISVSKAQKIKKLRQLLEAIDSYRESVKKNKA